MKRHIGLKWVGVLLVSVILLTAFVSHTVWSNPGSSEIPIEQRSFQSAHDYIVWEESLTYYRRKGSTGEISSGSNDDTIIQYAINQSESAGGSVYVKAGTYTASVTLKDNVTLYIEKGVSSVSVSIDSGADAWLYDMENDVIKRWVDGSLEWSTEESVSTASFVVDKKGSTVRVKNGTDNEIVASGTDARTVIQSALDSLTAGRTWKEKVVLKGQFTIKSTTLSIPSYTILDLSDAEILGYKYDDCIRLDGVHNADIIGGILDGQDVGGSYGIRLQSSAYDINIFETVFKNWDNGGIDFVSGTNLNVIRAEFKDISSWAIESWGSTSQLHCAFLKVENTAGIEVFAGTGNYIVNSYFYNQKAQSVYMSSSATTYLKLIGNTFDTMQGDYQFVRVADNSYLYARSNIFRNGYKGIREQSLTTGWCDIRHNDFIDVTFPVVITSSESIVTENRGFVTENSGTASNCVNGTYVSHGLAGTPDVVTLTISGSSYINSTCFLMAPTVIAKNSTHFQIGFYINNNGTITAVTTTNQRDIYHYEIYEP